jgi:hypothetical protein
VVRVWSGRWVTELSAENVEQRVLGLVAPNEWGFMHGPKAFVGHPSDGMGSMRPSTYAGGLFPFLGVRTIGTEPVVVEVTVRLSLIQLVPVTAALVGHIAVLVFGQALFGLGAVTLMFWVIILGFSFRLAQRSVRVIKEAVQATSPEAR